MLTQSFALCVTINLLTLAVLLFVLSSASETEITLGCEHPVNLMSPGYPGYYKNDVKMEWRVTSVSEERILVVFNDIDMGEASDHVRITDLLHTANRVIYRGFYDDAPSFLSLGHFIEIKFETDDSVPATGFNLTVHCYRSFPTLSLRIQSGGISPGNGLLEVYHEESGAWLPACADNWNSYTARTACRQLGYPEVSMYESEGGFNLDKNAFVLTRPCGEDVGVLQECSSNSALCPSLNIISLKCHRPGYQGCFKVADSQARHPNKSHVSTIEDCLLKCREQQKMFAFIRQAECFCLNATEGKNLLDNLPLVAKNEGRCNSSCPGNSNEQCGGAVGYPAWYSVYNASIGFCYHDGSVEHGQWSRNDSVFFGSSSTLTCDKGYKVKGSQTVQCVPGQSPYKPSWNSTFPSCLKEEPADVQPTPSNHGEVQATAGSSHWIIPVSVAVAVVVAVLLLLLLAIFLVRYRRKKRSKSLSQHAEEKQIEQPVEVLQSTPIPCEQDRGDSSTENLPIHKDVADLSATMQNRPLPREPENTEQQASTSQHNLNPEARDNTNTNTNSNTSNGNSNITSNTLPYNESHHAGRSSSRKLATAGSTPHVRNRRSKNELVSNAYPAMKLDDEESIDGRSEVSYAVPDVKKRPVKPRRYASKIYKTDHSKGQSNIDGVDAVGAARSSMSYAQINHQVPSTKHMVDQSYETVDHQPELPNYQTLENESEEPENGAQIYEAINVDP